MPWKTTRLLYCGIAVRRRTLYIIALVTSILVVPTFTWFLLTLNSNQLPQPERIVFGVAAALSTSLALNGWRHVLRRRVTLYWEEARFIWPLAMLGLIFANWLAVFVGWQLPLPNWTSHPGQIGLALPWVISIPLFFTILWRWIRLSQTERRYDYTDEEDLPPDESEPPTGPDHSPPPSPPPAA